MLNQINKNNLPLNKVFLLNTFYTILEDFDKDGDRNSLTFFIYKYFNQKNSEIVFSHDLDLVSNKLNFFEEALYYLELFLEKNPNFTVESTLFLACLISIGRSKSPNFYRLAEKATELEPNEEDQEDDDYELDSDGEDYVIQSYYKYRVSIDIRTFVNRLTGETVDIPSKEVEKASYEKLSTWEGITSLAKIVADKKLFLDYQNKLKIIFNNYENLLLTSSDSKTNPKHKTKKPKEKTGKYLNSLTKFNLNRNNKLEEKKQKLEKQASILKNLEDALRENEVIKPKEETIDKKLDSLDENEKPSLESDNEQKESNDRHKSPREVRYREKKLIEYLKDFNLNLVKNPNLNKGYKNFDIRIDLWSIKASQNLMWTHFFSNHTISKKSFFFLFDSGAGKQKTQREWLIVATIKRRRRELVEAIQSENPFKFKKMLAEIEADVDWTIKNLKINPFNILETRNKIAQKGGYNKQGYKELQKASTLLSRNKEFSIKMVNGFFTLDSDAYKKNPEERKAIENALEMMMNYLKINTYGLSKNGGWHLFFRCLEMIGNFTVYFNKFQGDNKFIQFADLQGQGKYVVASLSEDRRLVRRGKKWRSKNVEDGVFLFKDKAQMIKVFAKFGFYLHESKEVNDWKNYKRYKNSLKSTEKNVNNYENLEDSLVNYKEYEEKKYKSSSSKPSNKDYKEFVKKNVRITNIEILKEDSKVNENNSTLSRDSRYCKVFFIDEDENKGVLLMDKEWRKNEAEIVSKRFDESRSVNLILTKTDEYDTYLLKGVR